MKSEFAPKEEDSAYAYYCYACESRMAGGMWSLTRSLQRTWFKDYMNEVEVRDAECLSYYCSFACMQGHVAGVMSQERVPIPQQRPGIGPIECCAVCSSPVDMASFHRTYTLSDDKEVSPSVSQSLWEEDIAVVCDNCSGSAALAQMDVDTEEEARPPQSVPV